MRMNCCLPEDIERVLSAEGLHAWRDVVTHKTLATTRDGKPLDYDGIIYRIQDYYARRDIEVAKCHVKSALDYVLWDRPQNDVLNWITSKPWDGIDRVQELYGVMHIDNELERLFIHKWLLQGAAVLWNHQPGEGKPLSDHIRPEGILVISGDPATGKSLLLDKLAMRPEWRGWAYVGGVLHPRDIADRVWILELELYKPIQDRTAAFRESLFNQLSRYTIDGAGGVGIYDFDARHMLPAITQISRAKKAHDGAYWHIHLKEPIDFRRLMQMDTQQLWAQMNAEWLSGLKDWRRIALFDKEVQKYKEKGDIEELIRDVYDFNAPEDTWKEEPCINIATAVVGQLSQSNKAPTAQEVRDVQRALSKMSLRTDKRTKRGYLYRIPPKIGGV